MNKTIFETVIIFLGIYLLESFILWSYSFTDWGILGRLFYIIASIGIIYLNNKYANVRGN